MRKIWFLILLTVFVDAYRSSTECGSRKATYFRDFWGHIFVHYTYESLICSHGCCGSASERHCCSPTENHIGAIVGGSIGGVFVVFLMLAISIFLCKYYNMKKNRTNPGDMENTIGTLSYRTVHYDARKQALPLHGFRNEPPPEYQPSSSAQSTAELPPPYM